MAFFFSSLRGRREGGAGAPHFITPQGSHWRIFRARQCRFSETDQFGRPQQSCNCSAGAWLVLGPAGKSSKKLHAFSGAKSARREQWRLRPPIAKRGIDSRGTRRR